MIMITDFAANNNNSNSFRQINNGDTKDLEIMVPLKYLSNFWRTLEMPLINCKITLKLICSRINVLVAGTAANQVPKLRITDAKLY